MKDLFWFDGRRLMAAGRFSSAGSGILSSILRRSGKWLTHGGTGLLTPSLILVLTLVNINTTAQIDTAALTRLQQKFVGMRFGMFIHFNMPTFADADWPDPDMPVSAFNPTKLDCGQWADAALSANMSYGCLTTKHHSGFCIWDTKTTEYNVMNSPLKKDVVREYVNAFRKKGLRVMLYYSILDTHHQLRRNALTRAHIEMVKAQITELLSNYGEIDALIIDGWDAPWSRISYDDIPFSDVYRLVKKLQPQCVMMDLNGAKYPAEGLFYSDIKTYEMGAGQRLSKETNRMPALACLPMQKSWFWKTAFPKEAVKDPVMLVNDVLVPLNNASCNFILNVAPNREGLFDANALAALKVIGNLWKNSGKPVSPVATGAPIISGNLAKGQLAKSSWSEDSEIMDFANDDDFSTAWVSNSRVTHPWLEIDFDREKAFNSIAVTQKTAVIKSFRLEYFAAGNWIPLAGGRMEERVKILRFPTVSGQKLRLSVDEMSGPPAISEFGIYNEPGVQ